MNMHFAFNHLKANFRQDIMLDYQHDGTIKFHSYPSPSTQETVRQGDESFSEVCVCVSVIDLFTLLNH